MCGITGFIDYQRSISETNLMDASAALRHRGGDGNGYLFETHDDYNVGLAHERLATIDPSTLSDQPFTSNCGNYTITFNGTIYNYLDLRASLIKYGITFTTLSDTEVLLACYKKWGNQLFDKIDGAFAFAILDRKQKQLFVARDAMGVKPLYFYKDEHFFVFASELKGVLQYPIEKKANLNALEKYLRHGYFFGNETIFQDVWNFKKQHYFIIDLHSGYHLETKFKNTLKKELEIPTEEKALSSKLNDLIIESILKRNVADVSVGVMLSGGYDSATVAAVLQKNEAKKLKTFTLGFNDKTLNEADDAKAIAKHLNTNHTEYYIDNIGAIATLESLPDIFDEPMGDSGAIPLAFLVNKIAEGDTKVLLGAEGGDELFAGYDNYKKALWFYQKSKQTPNFLKNILISVSGNRKNKLREVLGSKNLLGTYEAITAFYAESEMTALLNKEVKLSLSLNEGSHNIKTLLAFDQDNYLVNDLLLKSDRISMFHSIDNRDALLNIELIDTLAALDEKWFIKGGHLKYLLKNITHQYIPKSLMERPKKGFSIPIVAWLNTIYKPYVEGYLSVDQLDKHRFFNTFEVFRIKNRFFATPNGNDARKIWLLLQFQMWYNKHIK